MRNNGRNEIRSGSSAPTAAPSQWLSWPLWYAAAVHLQCRLNRFHDDIMHIPVSQLNETTAHPRANIHQFPIPRTLRDFLLVAPPFHAPPRYVSSGMRFWCKASLPEHINDHPLLHHEDFAWFSCSEAEEGTTINGFYFGTVCVYENDSNRHLGVKDDEYGPVTEIEKADNDWDRDDPLVQAGMIIRQIRIDDADLLPVVTAGVYQGGISFSDVNTQKWFLRNDTMTKRLNDYFDKLSADNNPVKSSSRRPDDDSNIREFVGDQPAMERFTIAADNTSIEPSMLTPDIVIPFARDRTQGLMNSRL